MKADLFSKCHWQMQGKHGVYTEDTHTHNITPQIAMNCRQDGASVYCMHSGYREYVTNHLVILFLCKANHVYVDMLT